MARIRWAQCSCTSLVIAAAPATALGQSGEPSLRPERAGFSFELRLASGAATAALTESDRPVADFEALALAAGARFGWFLNPHVIAGAELGASWHTTVGALRVEDPFYFRGGAPSSLSYSTLAPLGIFVEVYPWQDAGWFVALTGSLGAIDLPSFGGRDESVLSAGLSLDVGYELGGGGKRGPAVFARYSRWAGDQFLFSEHPDGLASQALLVGLRWSFWTPEWQ